MLFVEFLHHKTHFYLNIKFFRIQNFNLNTYFLPSLSMTVPTNIPETQCSNHKSLQGSMGTKLSIPMEVLQHLLKTVMGILDDKEVESFSHWMSYRDFYNFTDTSDELYHISDNIQNYNE